MPEVLLALALCSLDWTTGMGCTINVAVLNKALLGVALACLTLNDPIQGFQTVYCAVSSYFY